MAYVDYMDFDVNCPRKAVKFNHLITNEDNSNGIAKYLLK